MRITASWFGSHRSTEYKYSTRSTGAQRRASPRNVWFPSASRFKRKEGKMDKSKIPLLTKDAPYKSGP